MKRSINRFLIGIFLIALSVQCSTKDDPAPAAGCTFTFKGTSYNLPLSVCGDDPGNGGKINSATNTAADQLLSLYKGGSIDGIVFSMDVNDLSGDAVFNSYGTGGTYSISISGTKWTFNGTLINVNDDANTGTISGTCTCTVTNP